MIDSLSPFQIPRRSGIAPCCAAAGAAVSVASTTIQASFDMFELLEGLSRYLGLCIYVRRTKLATCAQRRALARNAERVSQRRPLGIPLAAPKIASILGHRQRGGEDHVQMDVGVRLGRVDMRAGPRG